MVTRRERLKVALGDLKQQVPLVDALVGRVQSLGQAFGRLNSQKGGVAAGGGRGVFAGTLKDFATRDEFTGRAGTIGRGLLAGRLGGALLAFVSIEEFSRNVVNIIKNEKTFAEVVGDQIKFLLPTVLRDTLPTLVDEFGLELFGLDLGGALTRRERQGLAGELDGILRRNRELRALNIVDDASERAIQIDINRNINSPSVQHELEESLEAGH